MFRGVDHVHTCPYVKKREETIFQSSFSCEIYFYQSNFTCIINALVLLLKAFLLQTMPYFSKQFLLMVFYFEVCLAVEKEHQLYSFLSDHSVIPEVLKVDTLLLYVTAFM